MKRDFLTLMDLSPPELQALIERAGVLKQAYHAGQMQQTHPGKVLAMIFEKSSTRTRVSFEVAMAQLGGHAVFLSPNDTQLGLGEPLEDTARVLSEMVDCVLLRTFAHEKIEGFAQHSTVPVINGLSDSHHPCQLLADMQTYYETRGSIQGKKVAWLGDGNNVCHSYIHAARLLDFELHIACPAGYEPETAILAAAGEGVVITHAPREAVEQAALVVTDVWASMGQEQERAARMRIFRPYQVNRELLALAAADALFLHCLPAHRDEEVTAEVLDSEQSLVWEAAGNRLHSQKALLEFLIAAP